jgi:hypothetical protein
MKGPEVVGAFERSSNPPGESSCEPSTIPAQKEFCNHDGGDWAIGTQTGCFWNGFQVNEIVSYSLNHLLEMEKAVRRESLQPK